MRATLFSLSFLLACEHTSPPIDEPTASDPAPVDLDGDGVTEEDGDCDDTDTNVSPDTRELCGDEVDNDCDGSIDEDDRYLWYLDEDGDGIGGETTAYVCAAPDGYAETGGDCDDANPDIAAGDMWYNDDDGDGQGDPSDGGLSCEPVEGAVSNDADCDDRNNLVYVGAPELCDGQANDCATLDEWTARDEDGQVTFTSGQGLASDLSDEIGVTPDTLTVLTLEEHGTLSLCADPDAPRTWYLSLTASEVDVELIAINGRGSVTLSGAGEERVAWLSGGSLVIDGLVLGDGWSPDDGGAIYGLNTSVTIRDSALRDSFAAGYGGALYLNASSLTLSDSDVTGSFASADGGGLMLGYTPATLSNANFEGNEAQGSGGAIAVVRDSLRCVACTVSGNTAGDDGGGLYAAYDGEMEIGSSLIEGNQAGIRGGGVANGPYTTLYTLNDNTIVRGNSAPYGGGVWAWYNCKVTLTDGVSVTENQADYGGGVGLGWEGKAMLVLSNGSEIIDNTASFYGGGVLEAGEDPGYVTIDNAVVSGNVAGKQGGGVWAVRTENTCIGDASSASFEGIYGNSAPEGGGVWLGTDSSLITTSCDFDGSSPNTPDDVWSDSSSGSYDLGDNESVICNGEGC